MKTRQRIRKGFILFSFFLFPAKGFPENCKRCHTCTENCPMSLPVEEMVYQKRMENAECILCGTCVDGCNQGAIEYFLK